MSRDVFQNFTAIFDQVPQYYWLIGVLLAALASFISNLGVTLQKLDHLRHAGEPDSIRNQYHKRALWRVGLGLVIFGSIADLAALSFGPQSLIAPLGSLTLVSNVIFAPLLLHEYVTTKALIATAGIVIGSAIAVAFAPHEDLPYTVDELYALFERFPFIVYTILVLLYVGVFLAFLQNMEDIENQIKAEKIDIDEIDFDPVEQQQPQSADPSDPAAAATSPAADTTRQASAFFGRLTKFSSKQSVAPHQPMTRSSILAFRRLRNYQRFAYPSISGAAGAFSVVFAKCFILLFKNLVNGENVFVKYETYLVLSGLGASIFFQIRWLNDGLQRFDASYTVPVFTAFWILLCAISGLIFYREYMSMETNQMIYFGLGIFITVLCVVSLSRHHSTKRHEYTYTYVRDTQSTTDSTVVFNSEDSIASEQEGLLSESKRQAHVPALRGSKRVVAEESAAAVPAEGSEVSFKSLDDQA